MVRSDGIEFEASFSLLLDLSHLFPRIGILLQFIVKVCEKYFFSQIIAKQVFQSSEMELNFHGIDIDISSI